MKRGLVEVLEFFFWGLEVFSRRDLGLILAGLRLTESEWRTNQLLLTLERRRLVERRQNSAGEARFAITPEGVKQATVLDPERHWSTPWDLKWRVFLYDVPENRRRERILLWRALRALNLGLLQRSVWVWPHNVEDLLS